MTPVFGVRESKLCPGAVVSCGEVWVMVCEGYNKRILLHLHICTQSTSLIDGVMKLWGWWDCSCVWRVDCFWGSWECLERSTLLFLFVCNGSSCLWMEETIRKKNGYFVRRSTSSFSVQGGGFSEIDCDSGFLSIQYFHSVQPLRGCFVCDRLFELHHNVNRLLKRKLTDNPSIWCMWVGIVSRSRDQLWWGRDDGVWGMQWTHPASPPHLHAIDFSDWRVMKFSERWGWRCMGQIDCF